MAQQLTGIPIEASRICLGSAGVGTAISKDDSFAVMDAFIEAGGNFLDTAHIYAAWIEGGWGVSERTIGQWVRARGNRDDLVIATKGGHRPMDAEEKIGCLSQRDLGQHLSESLDRLQVDRVDLYWLHLDEPKRPVGEIIETLAGLKKDGRISSYGASNWKTDRIQAANQYANEHNLPPFIANQPWFSLGAVAHGPRSDDPTDDSRDPLRRWHVQTGLPMIPYSSQANGFFGEGNVAWAKDDFDGSPARAESFDSPANRRRLLRAIDLAEEKGCTANQLALAYLLHQPFPIYPIIGTGDPDHAREALGATRITLGPEEVNSLFT
jgi:aryl-alcohol dehydrogenase-like predicted oxidoreductase